MPTGQPWQKDKGDVTAAEDRYLMTVVATASNPRFTVSRVDVDRDGPTYTVDTLRDLAAIFPDDELLSTSFGFMALDDRQTTAYERDWSDVQSG